MMCRRQPGGAVMLLLLIKLMCCGGGLCADVPALDDDFHDLEQQEELDPLYELRGQQQPQKRDVVNPLRKKASDSSDASDDKKNACQRCVGWYYEDRRDRTWLHKVHREIPCPCQSQVGTYGHYAPNNAQHADWIVDPDCSKQGYPSCSVYNPGADGCMLSVKTSSTGARQQCCYIWYGPLLGMTHSGVGTPHRYGDPEKHKKYDVKPFKWCCVECKLQGYCSYYKNLRLGPYLHCK